MSGLQRLSKFTFRKALGEMQHKQGLLKSPHFGRSDFEFLLMSHQRRNRQPHSDLGRIAYPNALIEPRQLFTLTGFATLNKVTLCVCWVPPVPTSYLDGAVRRHSRVSVIQCKVHLWLLNARLVGNFVRCQRRGTHWRTTSLTKISETGLD